MISVPPTPCVPSVGPTVCGPCGAGVSFGSACYPAGDGGVMRACACGRPDASVDSHAPDAVPRVCVPGAQVPCACLGGGAGVQVCVADGTSLGPCSCPDAGQQPDAADASPGDTAPADVPGDVRADVPCPPGTTYCDGVCSALDTNENCGGCGVRCSLNQRCAGGRCACEEDFADCNGFPGDGCEVRRSSPTTCGGCGGAACPAMYSCSSLSVDGGVRYRCCPQGSTGATCRSTP